MAVRYNFGERYLICDWCNTGEQGEYVSDGYGDLDLCHDCSLIWDDRYELQHILDRLRQRGCTVAQVILALPGGDILYSEGGLQSRQQQPDTDESEG